MLDMPALRKEFEQLCECLRQNASLALPELAPWPEPLFFLKAENNLCHLDLLVRGGAEATEEASEGDLEASEEVEFENCLESAAANRFDPPLLRCTWGNSFVELDDIWFPRSPINKNSEFRYFLICFCFDFKKARQIPVKNLKTTKRKRKLKDKWSRNALSQTQYWTARMSVEQS